MTPDNSTHHHRRSIRLPGYDYAATGCYFITICTHGRALVFGEISHGGMKVNPFGTVIMEEWKRSAEMRRTLILDAVVVMPNHLHGMVTFTEDAHGGSGRAHGSAPLPDHRSLDRAPRSLGSFIAGFKAASTKRVNALRGTPGVPVFQRNYYEHVVRTNDAYARIYNYIMTNPFRWEIDPENPARYGDDEFNTWLGENDRGHSITPPRS